MTEPGWLEGPPTEPGLYWFQLQHSAVVRYCEVFERDGRLVIAGPEGWSDVFRPYRRWMNAGFPKPEPDPDWLDPRFIADHGPS